jgi:uncharacterized Zn-finger protein
MRPIASTEDSDDFRPILHDRRRGLPHFWQQSGRNQRKLGIAREGRYGVTGLKPVETMTDSIVPHFHNDPGVAVIEIGAREFMCVGAKPPFDHPHVFCDMGEDAEYICPYCSTLYRHDPTLAPNAARPAECTLPGTEN